MHIKIESKFDCSGCTACVSICPKNAIEMSSDFLGFKYPKVDEEKCIDCGLCIKTCDFHQNYNLEDNLTEQSVFGLRTNNLELLQKSQSGGAFFSIAEPFINSGGVVYGAIYDNNFIVRHIRASRVDELEPMHGSKYVQSDLKGVFNLVKEDLINGKKVLFTGTPCQVAGLKSFVRQNKLIGLFTIDLICKGVTGPKVWQDNINYVAKQIKGNLIYANMREKSFGWHNATEKYSTTEKSYIQKSYLDLYFNHFIHRDSCFKCPYANTKRVGDITIGDFWGWEKHFKEFNDNHGVSLILVNSRLGMQLFDSINVRSTTIKKCELQQAFQNMLMRPISPKEHYKEFRRDYEKQGYYYVLHKYGDQSIKRKIIRFVFKIKTLLKPTNK